MKKYFFVIAVITLFIGVVISCSKMEPPAPADDQTLDGPVDDLSYAQSAQHLSGDAAFNDQVFTGSTGLGPIFVATSCGGCHAGDGKGHPFSTLVRFGQTDSTGNQYSDQGGPQLQDRAIPGYTPEQIPAGATFAKFMPPINTGLGFLELVPDNDILAMSDPDDANGDGISGVPNWNSIPSYITIRPDAVTRGGKYICRFGKKGSVYNLLQQTVNAYNQDIGITSVFEPKDVYSHTNIDPEISVNTINDVVFYLQTLKAPVQRDQNNPDVMAGEQIFLTINCSGCHKPDFKTGYSPIDALSYKTFASYTDLLLHDMGPGLDDGYTEGTAATSEWRTPPLWGLGLAPKSQGRQYFLLHDGRAHSIQEAIELHGGEAAGSKKSFDALSEADKQRLIKFLESL